MKKMKGFADPITLGFIIMALGAGLASMATPNNKEQVKVEKAQIEAPQVVDNTQPR